MNNLISIAKAQIYKELKLNPCCMHIYKSIINEDLNNISLLKTKKCCKLNYLKLIFLKTGYIYVGNGYNLQLIFKLYFEAQYFINLVNQINVITKLKQHGNKYIVNVRSKENISDFLAYIGASKAVLRLNEYMVDKQMRDKINRENNYYIGNITKTLEASLNQLEAIKKIRENNLIDKINDKLKDVIIIREKYPNASLIELAKIIKISKSGLKHRLEKIKKISKEI